MRRRLERALERRSLKRNWSRHRPRVALDRPELASTTPVDLPKSPYPQASALAAATRGLKGVAGSNPVVPTDTLSFTLALTSLRNEFTLVGPDVDYSCLILP
jgi:hypothetical protein